ncbi:MAG: DUF2807 domain-containing protein [Rhizobiales bacterium]|nr:DUF2807 domain-containing protein [Hyphomicrobiales bacterium]NRB15285.1 DUF2807 domain-containing protein [Hyphomicrobiales bacterium]
MIDKKNILIGGAILVGLYLLNPFSGNAALDDRNFSYKTDTLSINNFVGRINISPSPDAELHINISNISENSNPKIDNIVGKLEINGSETIARSSCNDFSLFSWNLFGHAEHDNPNISINGGTGQKLSEYPILHIKLPETTKLKLNNNIITGSISNVQSLDLKASSCTSLKFANIAGDADISLRGSGDIVVNDIGGSAKVTVRGSGDVSVHNVAQDSQTLVQGSGDIQYNQLNGINRMQVHGSGDIDVGYINGDAELSVRGSGDIDIRGGDVNWLIAKIQGSGDIDYDGKANNTRFITQGSGDITTNYN